MTDRTTYDTYGVIRPHPKRPDVWLAFHGLGSQTVDLGEFAGEEAAAAAAGAEGRHVLRARVGESGWTALARERLDEITDRTGIDTSWLIRTGYDGRPEVYGMPIVVDLEELPSGTRSYDSERHEWTLDPARIWWALRWVETGQWQVPPPAPPDVPEHLSCRVDGVDLLALALEEIGLVDRIWITDRVSRIEVSPLGFAVMDLLWRGEIDRYAVVCGRRHPRQVEDADSYVDGRHCAACGGVGARGDRPPLVDASPWTPLGIPEIAERLGVQRETVDQWRARGILPDPDWTVGGRPAWRWSTIRRWARETGRI